jgi:hypothetical protein
VSEPHLDLLALASRLLKALSASERPRNVSGMLMDVARDLALWFLWTALRFEWAYMAVELTCAIQERLALIHRAARSELLSARAVSKTRRISLQPGAGSAFGGGGVIVHSMI